MIDQYPYALLDAPNWDIDKVDGNPINGKIRYINDGRQFRINWRPTSSYNNYLTSRRRISKTTTVVLFGELVDSWTYDHSDHTVITRVQGATFFEVRGEGMNMKAFVDLLARLHKVDIRDFGAEMPSSIVSPSEVKATVTRMLAGVATPEEFDTSTIQIPPYQEPYHVAANVTGSVGCAWIDHYAAARSSGDRLSRERAVDAMSSSRTWPVLREIQFAGGWTEEFWRVADDMAADVQPSELHGRICW